MLHGKNTGERPLPSFVAFDEEDVKCGVVVVNGFLKGKEKYTVFDVRRFIGKEFHDIVPDRSWPFEVIEENGKVKIKTENINGEVLKTPEEISAVLLKYMKEKAKEFQGKDETKTVLTVPAAFSEKQKQATLEAAKLAGWKTIDLLPEPIAASFAYFNNREIPNNSNILLFDLGGGTLDVGLFKIIDQKIEIISKFGDICLGGRDIDNLLIRHFSTILRFRYNINVNEKIRRKYRLMLECQKIKQNLTAMKKDTLNVETFDSNINGVIEIERFELEELMTDLLQRMKTAINQTLNNANLAPKEIHKVLQVGGGCRMPVVKEMLKNMFPNSENCVEENPDEVVAVGAAIYAYHLATINDEDKNV
uniref:Heat shock protein 70 n=1 Tax=Panagrolaimus superbus TaxID=310955 RepID=A0A914YW03_9BILA